MSKKNSVKKTKIKFHIPHSAYYHKIVDMFELNNITVNDLHISNKHGHVVELEIQSEDNLGE